MLAILAEVTGTTSIKLSNGFSKIDPSILVFVFYVLSLSLLNFALKGLGVGIAYAIWSGVGTALIVIIGVFYFSEQMTFLKMISIVFIVLGVIGLQLGEQQSQQQPPLIKKRSKENNCNHRTFVKICKGDSSLSRSLKILFLVTDTGFIFYWTITFFEWIPKEYLYQNYQNPLLYKLK